VALNLGQLRAALRDGKPDPSPNAGVSQAAYAHRIGVKMGGVNHYEGVEIIKPLLNKNGREVQAADIVEILRLNKIIALRWLVIAIITILLLLLLF
jgi:adenosylcobinamide-phosphate synthase